MKKTLILALTAFSCSILNTSLFAQNSANTTLVSNPSDRISTGTITEITSNGIKAIDNTTGEVLQFAHPGAQFEFIVGDSVSYTLITLPNGRTITKDVRK